MNVRVFDIRIRCTKSITETGYVIIAPNSEIAKAFTLEKEWEGHEKDFCSLEVVSCTQVIAGAFIYKTRI